MSTEATGSSPTTQASFPGGITYASPGPRIMHFTLCWAYLDSTIQLRATAGRGKRVGKEEELWPGAWN
jgi:hypothetical protein